MKILIAAEIFPPDIGGPATYSLELATEMTNQGHQATVICYSTKKENNNYNFNLIRVLRGQNFFFRYCKYFLSLLKYGRSADVFYAQGPVGSGLPAFAAAKILRKKLFVKVVGDYAWEQAINRNKTDIMIDDFQKQKPAGKIGVLKKIEIFVCKNAYRVIAPSQYLKKIVISWGAKEEKIIVIYNAIKSGANAQSILTESDYILSIGRLVPWKGFKLLIEILPELLKLNPNFQLIILGKGPQKEELIKLTKKLNLENKVEIKRVDFKTRDQYLKSAKLFVLNTGYEGLSHTILEAMAASVPIITTNSGGNPELVKDGYNGILINYNNKEQLKSAIVKLWQDQELQKKFVANSKEELKKFTFEKMINNTINILNS